VGAGKYLVERWQLVLPALLLIGTTWRSAIHPSGWSVAGIVISVVWLVFALRSLFADDSAPALRPDGLTSGMATAMHRALAEKPMAARPRSSPATPDMLEWDPNNATQVAGDATAHAKGEPVAQAKRESAAQANGWPPAAEPKTASDAARADAPSSDALAKVKLGGREVFQRITQGLKNERGVHVESLLACLGALAGYACQAAVRENSASAGASSPENALTVATGADGRKYFFGDPLNRLLAEDRGSVWSFTAGAVQHLGKPLPDIEGIFQHVASTVGGAEFGIPRIPAGHRLGDLPINYLKAVWPQLLPIAKRFADEPAHLPMIYGLAIQHAIFAARNLIDPTLAATIAMECAVPMSKVDLG
jgi:hypothetical protein